MISLITSSHMDGSAEKLRASPQALNLQFRGLSYSLPEKNGKLKKVLHDVTGQILSGRLTAILGPSGAGKTSLLNVLAGFKTKGVTGSVLVNGAKRNLTEFRTQTCYITQDLSLLGQLTTYETMTVAAKLKVVSSDQERSFVVSEILELLGLSRSQHTFVQNLSGGEKKRLSIGLELITNPPIMLVDEPTSGVDSVSSNQIISHLKRLAAAGRAVACVIHQPSSKLCEMFDDVILLAAGQILYCGPTNQIIPVFKDAGFRCPDHYNRADFVLEVACRERGEDLSNLLERPWLAKQENFEVIDGDLHAKEDTQIEMREDILNFAMRNNASLSTSFKHTRQSYPISVWQQFWILLQRTMLCTYRDLFMAKIRLTCHVLVGVLLGTIFYDVGGDGAKITSNASCLFFFALFLFFSNAMPTIITFPLEMSVFLREHLNNWYSLPPYLLAKCLANFPLQILCPTAFLLTGYWMTGQPYDIMRFAMALLVCILTVIVAQTMGMTIGAACDPSMGMFVVPVSTIPMLLFSGFFQRLQDIPSYLKWLGQISYFRNAFEGMVTSIYGFNRARLFCSEPFCFFRSPAKFVETLGMRDENYWFDICALCAWIVGLHLLLFAVLKWRIHNAK